MNKYKEIRVAIIAIVSVTVLYLGFNYLRGMDVFSPNAVYYVKYSNVGGLNKGDKVMLSGLEVGSVLETRFDSDTYDEIVVTLAIDKNIKLREGTIAKLAKPDILGAVEIQLILNPFSSEVLKSGGTLIAEVDRGVTELLTEGGLSAANSLTATVNKINEVLEPFVLKKDTIGMAIDNFEKFTKNLVQMSGLVEARFYQVSLRMEYLSDSLMAVAGDLRPVIRKYGSLADSLQAIDINSRLKKMDEIMGYVQSIAAKLDSDQGTFGKLMTDDSLYNTLTSTLTDLDSLLIDLNENPKRYVHFSLLGRSDRPPKKKNKKKK